MTGLRKNIQEINSKFVGKGFYFRCITRNMTITFDKDIISLSKFQILQTKCIAALAEKYQDFYFELLPDIQLDSMDEEKIKAQTEENT